MELIQQRYNIFTQSFLSGRKPFTKETESISIQTNELQFVNSL
ncbi:hypothetical protein FBHYGVHD_CDS0068 [Staphylococcus phage MVC_VPHSA1]|uniref:Uncharacterized protein n=1 Tax=Staphylococcus phage MVC_VPHSA1 TaxID=3088876 RepID=A0ABZ0QZT2_9CAUD|nr:hypothetical protein FBHYGVHD_CDS0068 [Staphylococcus phage MVC_VPHSA1]